MLLLPGDCREFIVVQGSTAMNSVSKPVHSPCQSRGHFGDAAPPVTGISTVTPSRLPPQTAMGRNLMSTDISDLPIWSDVPHIVANMAITAAAMTPVAAQPSVFTQPVTANSPITFGAAASHIMIAMTGTATMPLITALQ